MQDILSLIKSCDVIIHNRSKEIVGLHYDNFKDEAPKLIFKRKHSPYIITIAGRLSNCYIESDYVARNIFKHEQVGEILPTKYWSSLAIIYNHQRQLNKGNCKNFSERLKNDVLCQFSGLEKTVYKGIHRKFLNKIKKEHSDSENKNIRFFKSELKKLTKEYKVKIYRQKGLLILNNIINYELLETKTNITFSQIIDISRSKKKITIVNAGGLIVFEFNQIVCARDFLSMLLNAYEKQLGSDIEVHSKEYDINPKQYEISKNSMQLLLQKNFDENNIIYSFSSNTTVLAGYLWRKKMADNKMYNFVITHKEFLRNPEAFKDFIKNPHPRKQWNFWCREQNYNPKFFDEKN